MSESETKTMELPVAMLSAPQIWNSHQTLHNCYSHEHEFPQ
jgi:hypothetical protein